MTTITAIKLGLATLLVAALTLIPHGTASAYTYRTAHDVSKQGIALYYSSGVMERVLRVRARQGYHVRYDVAGYTASVNCGDIGRIVYISVSGGPYRRYQVMDCSQPYHRSAHIARGIVAELDWHSAVREGYSRDGRASAVVYYP